MLAADCPAPADLPENVTAQQLAFWTRDWQRAYACERGGRLGLLSAWPR